MHFLPYADCACAGKYYFRSIFHSNGPRRKKVYRESEKWQSTYTFNTECFITKCLLVTKHCINNKCYIASCIISNKLRLISLWDVFRNINSHQNCRKQKTKTPLVHKIGSMQVYFCKMATYAFLRNISSDQIAVNKR
jgi:hypothetical protein